MDYSYPLLEKVFNYYKKEGMDLSEFRVYSCQHLLAPQFEMYKRFISFGFKPEDIYVLGKAYSTNPEVVDDLRKIGIQVFQPEFTGKSFDEEHSNNCNFIAEKVSDENKNIILDDGGYLINVLKTKKIFSGVEQTSSGFRKLENQNLSFPVYNVARSKTKLTQESPLIARLILDRTKAYIDKNNIISPKFLVIGLGPIGNSILQILNEEGSPVVGFDIEKDRNSLITYLRDEKPVIVIGATGNSLFSDSDLADLEGGHEYHFISASSSDREFPVVPLRTNNEVHQDVVYKNFIFVNNSFPITFLGNKYESTPIEIEKTIALLMGSVFHSVNNPLDVVGGIIDVPEELEQIVNGD
jgi:hypothetical protein